MTHLPIDSTVSSQRLGYWTNVRYLLCLNEPQMLCYARTAKQEGPSTTLQSIKGACSFLVFPSTLIFSFHLVLGASLPVLQLQAQLEWKIFMSPKSLVKKMVQQEHTFQRMTLARHALKSILLPLVSKISLHYITLYMHNVYTIYIYTHTQTVFTVKLSCIIYLNLFLLFNWFIFLPVKNVWAPGVALGCINIFPIKINGIFFSFI